MSNDLGVGLGLQATLPEARDMFQANQQEQARLQQEQLRMAQAKKEKQDAALESAKNDFRLNGNYKWHRLLVGDAIAASNKAIDDILRLKADGSENWENKIPDIQKSYNERMIPLVALNENYHDFDAQAKMFDSGTTYSTQNMQKAREAFMSAKNLEDLKSKWAQLGIQNDPFLAVDPNEGFIVSTPPRRLDLTSELKAAATTIAPIPTVKSVNEDGKLVVKTFMERPLTKEDALRLYNEAPDKAVRFPYGPPFSIEDSVEKLMSHPDFVFQYADANGLNPNDQKAISERLFEDMKLFTGHTESTKVYMPKTTNINVSTGDRLITQINSAKAEPNTFQTGAPDDKLYFFNSFTPQVDYTVKSVTGTMVPDADTGKINTPSLEEKGNRVDSYYLAPYVIIDGKKYPYTDKRANKPIEGMDVFIRFKVGSNWYSEQASKYTPVGQIEGSAAEKVAIRNEITTLNQQADLMNKFKNKWTKDPANKGKTNQDFIQAANEYIRSISKNQ